MDQEIHEKIISLNYDEYTAEIKTADAQESHKGGVIVLVTGCLTGKDNVRRKFSQTFFLAPQEKGYFVLNDVFRYIEVNDAPQLNSASVNVISENAETVHEPESGLHFFSIHTHTNMYIISMFVYIQLYLT